MVINSLLDGMTLQVPLFLPQVLVVYQTDPTGKAGVSDGRRLRGHKTGGEGSRFQTAILGDKAC